jgi:peptidoglycan/xylan/chitin deacetylase (PgdA/CDA1 family)
VPILLYHSISDRPASWIAPLTVSPSAFRRHLDLVVASGREALTVSELVRRRRRGDSCADAVVVTFDDGFADFADAALPLMNAAGLPATLYVTTGALRGRGDLRAWEPLTRAPFLRWDQLAGIEAAGVELGAHTSTHRQLDLLPKSEIRAELERSKGDLEDALGHAVASFAYPHGHANRRVRALTRAAGFSSACAVHNALSPRSDDPFRIARLTVTATTSDDTMQAWLRGEGAAVATSLDHWRAMVGRAWRRLQRRQRVATAPEDTPASAPNLLQWKRNEPMMRTAAKP